MIRLIKVYILLISFVLLLSYTAAAENCVLETDDRRMCYDCVFFDDAWPGDIRNEMERLFPAFHRFCLSGFFRIRWSNNTYLL